MKNLFALLFILSVHAVIAQDKSFTTATSPDGKYSITHLKGWVPTFNSANTEIFIKGNTGNIENIPLQLALTKESNVAATVTLDDFSAKNFLLIKNLLNATVAEKGSSKINGVDAEWTTYTYDVNERSMKAIAYFFIQNGNAYQLVIHAAESDFKSMEPALKQVAESLTIK